MWARAEAPPDWSAAKKAYDALAARYDRIPEENRINRILRARSLGRLRAIFRPGQHVLEIGCGTGDEAIELAALGLRILAVDPSPEMVRIARAKAEARGVGDRVTFREASARDIGSIPWGTSRFDGAYASFSLAYEPDLRPVAAALHGLLRPGATLAVSLPSRVCLSEWVASLAAMKPSMAGRRLRPWHGHKVGEFSVPIRSYTPTGLARAFAPAFVLLRWEAMTCLVPPPSMNRVFERLDGLADAIERADAVLRGMRVFRSVGDHFLAELRHAASV